MQASFPSGAVCIPVLPPFPSMHCLCGSRILPAEGAGGGFWLRVPLYLSFPLPWGRPCVKAVLVGIDTVLALGVQGEVTGMILGSLT